MSYTIYTIDSNSIPAFQPSPQVANCLLWWWEVQLDELESLSNRSGDPRGTLGIPGDPGPRPGVAVVVFGLEGDVFGGV